MANGNKTTPDALEAVNIVKSFGAVKALDKVSLTLRHGEVTALLGDNGAGKSTLVKCISGVFRPDSGKILIDGTQRRILGPSMAREMGIETVHQNLAIINHLNVIENLFLNRELCHWGKFGRWLGFLDRGKMKVFCEQTLSQLNIRIPSLNRPVERLSGGQRQSISIGRAVAWGQRIVLLDEPAAALGVEQTQKVLDLIVRLRDQGVAVLLITHNMDRVTAVCDYAVILRQGRKVAEVNVKDITKNDLVAHITGAEGGLSL